MDIKAKKILIACYQGNNGGDGFVAAKYLSEFAEVDILFIGDEQKFKEATKINYKKAVDNHKIQFIDVDGNFDDYDIIIDAILGTGVTGRIKDSIRNIILRINETNAYKVSVDIPTGLNPETGQVDDIIVNPDLIITFHDLKTGLKNYQNKIEIIDIGIR